MASVQDFSEAIRAAAEGVGPAVVGLGRGWGHGSGVVVGEGRVLTNAHNLRRDEPTVVFGDDRREAAGILAADRDLDLAVLEVDTGDVSPVTWAEAGEPGIGTPVLALGNADGRGGAKPAQGIINALDRSILAALANTMRRRTT